MPAPPPVVWDLITDWEHQHEWMLEASDFEVVSAARQGIGVQAEATVTIAGISTRDKVTVIGWEPNHRLAIRHEGWVSGTGEIFLTPIGTDRTHVFWREDLAPPVGIAGAVGLTAFKPVMKRIFQRDLRVLAALCRAAVAEGGRRRT